MPNTASAAKAMRQSKRRQKFNLQSKERFKKAIKQVKKFIKEGKKSEAAAAMKGAMSALDKAVKKHVIPLGAAARKKSRLAKALATTLK